MAQTENARVNDQSQFYVPLERSVVEPLAVEWRFKPDPNDQGETQEWFKTRIEDRTCATPAAW